MSTPARMALAGLVGGLVGGTAGFFLGFLLTSGGLWPWSDFRGIGLGARILAYGIAVFGAGTAGSGCTVLGIHLMRDWASPARELPSVEASNAPRGQSSVTEPR
ncbi:MAG: hypothetical protein U0840_23850 [Gemmataceae bacterium]